MGNPDYVDLLHTRSIPAEHLTSLAAMCARVMQLLDDGVELVHSHGYESDYVAALCSLSRRRTAERPAVFVATTHGFIWTGIKIRAKTLLNYCCLPAIDALITVSRPMAEHLGDRRLLPTVAHIPNGIFPVDGAGTATNGCQPPAPRVGFVGRLAPEKRPDLFLETAAVVRKRRCDVQFIVIGGGPEHSRLLELRRQLDLDDTVVFEGYVRDVAPTLRTLSVLLCCSTNEGTPRAVLEAMSAGVPVVATAVGGIPEIIDDGKTGVLIPPGDAEAAAEAILDVLADVARARDYAAAARHRVNTRFSIETMRSEVDAVYRRARAKRGVMTAIDENNAI
jgi:glycosyltransferase involved in cell wall biosynthesis